MTVCNVGDLGSIPESGRFSGEGNGNPLQYSCLENSMDGEPSSLHSMGSESDTTEQLHFTCILNPSPSSSFWNCTGCVPTYIANFLSSTGLSTTVYKHNLISPILKVFFPHLLIPLITIPPFPLPPLTLTVKLLKKHLCSLSKIPLLPSSFKLTPIRFMP